MLRPELRHHLLRRALGEQLAEGDVGDLVAALGFVHVMGGDQHGDAVGGQPVNLVPEFAARLGIDAGGRLVEQQQARLRQDAGAEREPLLPAAGQLAGELVLAAGEPEPGDRALAPRLCGSGHAIDARHEFEILADRQIGIEAEALRHVADIALDLVLLGENVVAEAGAFAGIRREQPAQHAERRGLAAAVRPEKAVNLALRHFEAQIAHHGARTEALGQARDVDGDLLHRRTICSPGPSVTVTGWPAVSLAAGPSGRASTR